MGNRFSCNGGDSFLEEEKLKAMILDRVDYGYISGRYLDQMAHFNLLDLMNSKGQTLLLSSIKRQDFEFTHALLDKGAAVNLKRRANSNAILTLLESSDNINNKESYQLFQRLVDIYGEQKYGEKISIDNMADDQVLRKALHHSISRKLPKFCNFLMEKGLDMQVAFEEFLLKGDIKNCELMLVNEQVDVDYVFSNGETFLMRLVEQIDIYSEEIRNAIFSDLNFSKTITKLESKKENLNKAFDILSLAGANTEIVNTQNDNKKAVDYTSFQEVKDTLRRSFSPNPSMTVVTNGTQVSDIGIML